MAVSHHGEVVLTSLPSSPPANYSVSWRPRTYGPFFRTFCTTFGYPSTSSSLPSPHENARPESFRPTGRTYPPTTIDLSDAIFGTNELEAVAFFNDMINLTRLRDQILNSTAPNQQQHSPESISTLLRSTLRDAAQGEFTPSGISVSHLRGSISDLAHYNAIQVIAVHLCPPANGTVVKLPSETALSARATLQVILETRTRGATMCLWMWLYYAFTASVVLFLHSISNPLNQDAVLDLALLDELKGLCEALGGEGPGGSDGARRVKEIVDGMGKVAWEVVKRAARRRKGVESASAGEGEGESSRVKRMRSGAEGEEEPRTEPGGTAGAVEGTAEAGPAGATRADVLNLENVPQNFEWEQWDQWLEDAPFEVE